MIQHDLCHMYQSAARTWHFSSKSDLDVAESAGDEFASISQGLRDSSNITWSVPTQQCSGANRGMTEQPSGPVHLHRSRTAQSSAYR